MLAPLEDELRDPDSRLAQIPSREEFAEIRKLLMRPEIRDAVSKELFHERMEVIAERTRTDPDVDM